MSVNIRANGDVKIAGDVVGGLIYSGCQRCQHWSQMTGVLGGKGYGRCAKLCENPPFGPVIFLFRREVSAGDFITHKDFECIFFEAP